jgi:hypothetical protein
VIFFKKPEWLKEKDETEMKENGDFVFEVFELFKIDGNNEEIFRPVFRRGDVVGPADIRHFLMNYIKENNLQNPDNSK